ncbi:hypothetical protein BABINDRAFT_88359 [Babjeviella inositovora NRRL Y-12698]|uniref:Uncharacterized protein n=1 Tax=Babjeviella inositovora NRRL Y-12698 TaxID=984486 RepID=A0A1E3QL50_9ASCO|nr:uncharacterized protein BABINDRAFT_88359 [Babjeviella inositovora NRRL Y-12698]ODQ78194.1 hypothetical protein BABINDRAFT_88359 [Babjeviella inositovora NRRL Y-12698]
MHPALGHRPSGTAPGRTLFFCPSGLGPVLEFLTWRVVCQEQLGCGGKRGGRLKSGVSCSEQLMRWRSRFRARPPGPRSEWRCRLNGMCGADVAHETLLPEKTRIWLRHCVCGYRYNILLMFMNHRYGYAVGYISHGHLSI